MQMRFRLTAMALVALLTAAPLFGWGSKTHKFINGESVKHLPAGLPFFAANKDSLSAHAADADNRKGADPSESPKHFIDIDDYPEFAADTLSHDLNVLIARHGSGFVYSAGILPWATVWSFDSLTAALARHDWSRAIQFAADLGHYVGDGHQPLHVTSNYDGNQTGNGGIHSRYESSMMSTYLPQVTVARESVQYVGDPIEYVFEYLGRSNALADSIMLADDSAKTIAGATTGSTYYAALWVRTRSFTVKEIQSATLSLASLYYTAAVNAGLVVIEGVEPIVDIPAAYALLRNYPNPFNPSTTIEYSLAERSRVTLRVYSMLGQVVGTLSEGVAERGTYRVSWNSAAASGVYICRLEGITEGVHPRRISSTIKMLLLR